MTPKRLARMVLAAGLGLCGVRLVGTGLAAPAVPTPIEPASSAATHVALTADQPFEPRPERPPARADRVAPRDAVTGPLLTESRPVSVSIPEIGVRSALVDLGLDENGAMEVPRDPDLAGWFTRSAAPGTIGPAVIAGHVTWNGAPGVFYRLGSLEPGQRVAVTRRDGNIAVFVVERVARYSKERFPTSAVYGSITYAGLRLITCGGDYDRSQHRYEDNIVVFARLTTVRPARS